MEQKKNIDRLFQEKFKDFEVAPDDAVWDKIEHTLQKDKRKRRIIPIWWKLGGVAALIALLFTVGKLTLDESNINKMPNTTIVDNKKDSTSINKSNKTTTKPENNRFSVSETNNKTLKETHNTSSNQDSASPTNVATAISKNKSNATHLSQKQNINSNNYHKDKYLLNSSESGQIAENSSAIKSTTSPKTTNNNDSSIEDTNGHDIKTKTFIDEAVANTPQKENSTNEDSLKDEIVETIPNAIEEAIAQTTSEDTDKKDSLTIKSSKWRISPNIAPVYFNSLGEGSPIAEQFVQNSKSGDINMSYGIYGSYAFNNRLKVRVGLNKMDLNQTTNNVILYNNTNGNTARMQNISSNSSTSIMSAQNLSINSFESIKTENNNTIDQQFGFIEVPIELEYVIVNKKIGVHVIGGFSTLFLNNNDIYAISDHGERIKIGEASNIENTSFSANLGLGLNYNLSRSFGINLEPMFKYQINTFSNTSGDFKPYFIGIYSGLSFKF